VPTVFVWAPRSFALRMSRDVWFKLSESCISSFEAYLVEGFSEGLHASSFVFRDGPPWGGVGWLSVDLWRVRLVGWWGYWCT
jgi:hypothetical protein